ncbi:MAG: iron-containing alcohol dehydrogenase [Firmicutes bacterium]|uniref:Iron-containing alcohol dehydrogenase n=1 Tax=Candidatus Onthovivens merdipullorum TaxID=2840889 RepID=A0A9D9DIU8_9BACL|nr:iron-containing alcohol dehydrogenase [Candidatus Onthovivens merdipullorum]
MAFNFYIPTKIIYGVNSLKKLHEQDLPFKKALIVTTNGKSIIKYGYLDSLKEELNKAHIEYIVYSKILPNPIKDHVMEASEIAKINKCDVIIGIGGGSAIDSAKSIAVMATNPGDYWDYIEGGTGKNKPLVNKPLPIIAITTTSGTGTEADPFTVITNNEEKIGFGDASKFTFPYLSIVDPMLTVTIPSSLTAYQGFDALFHSMEGYLNVRHNEISDLFALKAVSLISKSLPVAINDGKNIEARSDVMLANTYAGLVESLSGCTAEHSIAHAMSGIFPSLIHGYALIIISLAYYEHEVNSKKVNDRLIDLAKALGKLDANKASDILIALKDLINKCGVSDLKLSTHGVKEEDFIKITENAFETMGGLFKVDPSNFIKKDVIEILKKSYK